MDEMIEQQKLNKLTISALCFLTALSLLLLIGFSVQKHSINELEQRLDNIEYIFKEAQ
jgi:hypothetical protein